MKKMKKKSLSGLKWAALTSAAVALAVNSRPAAAQHQELNISAFQQLQKELYEARLFASQAQAAARNLPDAATPDVNLTPEQKAARNQRAVLNRLTIAGFDKASGLAKGLASNYSEGKGDAKTTINDHIPNSDFYMPRLIIAYSRFEIAHLSDNLNEQESNFLEASGLPLAADPREPAKIKGAGVADIKNYAALYSNDLMQMMTYVSWLRVYQIESQAGRARSEDAETAALFLAQTRLLRKKIERFDSRHALIYRGLPSGSGKIFGEQKDYELLQDAILSEHNSLMKLDVTFSPGIALTGPDTSRRLSGTIVSLLPVELQVLDNGDKIGLPTLQNPGKFTLDINLSGEGTHHITLAVSIPRPNMAGAVPPVTPPAAKPKVIKTPPAPAPTLFPAFDLVLTNPAPNIQIQAVASEVSVHANQIAQGPAVAIRPFNFTGLNGPEIAWLVTDAATGQEITGASLPRSPLTADRLRYDYAELAKLAQVGAAAKAFNIQARVYWPAIPNPNAPLTETITLTIKPDFYDGMAFIVAIGKYRFAAANTDDAKMEADDLLPVLKDKELIETSLRADYHYTRDQIYWVRAGIREGAAKTGITVSPSLEAAGLNPADDPTTEGGTKLSRHFLMLALKKFSEQVALRDASHVFLSYSGHGYYYKEAGINVDMLQLPVREQSIPTHKMAELLYSGGSYANMEFTPNPRIKIAGFYDACISIGKKTLDESKIQTNSSGGDTRQYSFMQSCQVGQTSKADENGGYFVQALQNSMDALKGSDHWMDLLARDIYIKLDRIATLMKVSDQTAPRPGGDAANVPYVKPSSAIPGAR